MGNLWATLTVLYCDPYGADNARDASAYAARAWKQGHTSDEFRTSDE